MIPGSADHLSSSLLAQVLGPAIRSLILGAFAATALAALRVKSVSLRLQVWKWVLVIALAMPFLGLALPGLRISLPAPRQMQSAARWFSAHTSSVSSVQGDISRGEPSLTQHVVAKGTYAIAAPEHRATSESSLAPHSTSRTPAVASPWVVQVSSPPQRLRSRIETYFTLFLEAARRIRWVPVAAAIYFVVALVLLARFIFGLYLSYRLRRAAHPLHQTQALAILREHISAAGLRRVPRLASCDLISVPVALGVIRPMILFPADWASWEESELRAVIAHEASHVARHDALAQHLSLLHRAIFWFSPLGWWLHRSLVELAEAASDEAALASGADQIRYAETLLGFFAELEAADGRIWWQGVSMAKLGHAERRVDHILSWKGSSTMNRTGFAVIAVAAIALPVVVVTAAVRPSVTPVSDGTIWQSAQKAPSTPAAPGNPQEPSAPSGEEAPLALPPPAVSAPKIPPPPQSRVIVIPPMPVVRPMPSLPRVITIPDMAELKTLSALSSKQLMIMANRMAQQQGQDASSDVQYYFLSDQNGPNYMISVDNLGIVASGSNISISTDGKSEYDDLLRSRRVKIGGDFIQFEREGKSYIIRDPATISRAKQILAPLETLSKQQEELGKQQEELGKKQEALGKQMEEVRVKIPDITADIEALKAKANALSKNGGTQEDLGDLQSQIGDLQSRIGEMQSQAGIEQSKIGRQQGELGRQQGAIGRKQGDIGRQQGELSEKVAREMQSLFDEALSKGIAKPE